MRITQHYGLGTPVSFLDVHVERDNRLFVDPSAIRNNITDPLAQRAHQQLLDFFTELIRCRNSASPADTSKGRDLLLHFHEPNETRLGMSAVGVAGHGIADGLAAELWHELDVNPACQTAALTRVEDMKLFIRGVGDDLTSDLTTRVIYEVLVDFTHQMMALYPPLGVGATNVDAPVYDPTSTTWASQQFLLPAVAGQSLLLVPKSWVFWRMLMDPDVFYNRQATRTVQEEQTTTDAQGNPVAPSKAQIKANHPDKRELNSQKTADYKANGEDLVERHRQWVDANYYEPLSDGEIASRTD